MYAGCLAIIFILILMVVLFFRSGKIDYALAVAPLGLVPAAHLIGYPLCRQLGRWFAPEPALFATLVDLGALAVSAILFGLLAGRLMETGRNRKIYLVSCGLYSVALTMVLVSSLVTF